MNILLIGSGGREHAIAWALQKSPNTDVLYVAPGNGGTAEIAENVDLDIADGEALLSFVHERNIGLVVIGPEAPWSMAWPICCRPTASPCSALTPTAPSWKALKPIPRNS